MGGGGSARPDLQTGEEVVDEHASADPDATPSLDRIAFTATLHCLTGCAIGEVLGMIIGTALGWSNPATIALSVVLAFAFGYSLTMLPLLRSGLALGVALPLAFASDSLSIAVMELGGQCGRARDPRGDGRRPGQPALLGLTRLCARRRLRVRLPAEPLADRAGQGHAVVHAYHGSGDASDQGSDVQVPRSGPGSPRVVVVIGILAIAVTIAVTVGAALLLES